MAYTFTRKLLFPTAHDLRITYTDLMQGYVSEDKQKEIIKRMTEEIALYDNDVIHAAYTFFVDVPVFYEVGDELKRLIAEEHQKRGL